MMETVAIVGLGLIGGSFGLALRKAGYQGSVLGVSEPEYASKALEMGAITSLASLDEACLAADLIYLSQPVAGILKTIEEIGPRLRSGCLVTDAGSTKRAICQQAEASIQNADFLGGHPMAGKEKRGIQEADADLFQRRTYVLTPFTGKKSHLEGDFVAWLQRMGSSVIFMTPDRHDEAVAYTSHLPQLLSSALANTVSSENSGELPAVFGPGLIDMTRLAISSADLWTSILETNRDMVSDAIDSFQDHLQALKKAMHEKDLPANFTAASVFAEALRKSLYKI